MMGGLVFGAPAMLAALALLPVVWWLLRLTPPKPVLELFPPLKVLRLVRPEEETPDKSPWWLTALRLLMAAAIIIALAKPQLRPDAARLGAGSVLALVVDNTWATAGDWAMRADYAAGLIREAGNAGRPVLLAFTAEAANSDAGPFDAAEAAARLAAMRPEPVPADRIAALARIDAAMPEGTTADVAFVGDGLAHGGEAVERPDGLEVATTLVAESDARSHLAIVNAGNTADGFTVTLSRADEARPSGDITAFDNLGRMLATAPFSFGPAEASTDAVIDLPLELRNDITSLRIDGRADAAAVRLIDDSARRRRVALIAGTDSEDAQPLLAPLYYIERAIRPFADVVVPAGLTLGDNVADVINQRVSVIVLADIGVIRDDIAAALGEWVDAGGVLVRFAGPRLAAAVQEDDGLLPVRLRLGERQLGGALSWSQPQPVAPFPQTGPFAGLTPPRDVTVSRQVLAEPDIDLPDRTWASLADGTPLVTGRSEGRGSIALFHIAPEATWSNLPITGSFVDMLAALTRLAGQPGGDAADTGDGGTILPPWRVLDAAGNLVPPPAGAEPVADSEPAITFAHPPGLYGTAEAHLARNLFDGPQDFAPFTLAGSWPNVRTFALAPGRSDDLRPPLYGLAFLLLLADGIAMLVLGGALARMRIRPAASAAALGLAVLLSLPDGATAQEPGQSVSEADAITAIAETRLAHVITGDRTVDGIALAGLKGLSMFLEARTALEPGAPAGVDLERDELAFYPLLYWPISASAPMPSAAAIARVDAYLRNGGTVLFDTRDRLTGGFAGSASAESLRLREIVAGLNIPPIEPVPADHVLTKSFFIMDDFPGRYRGGDLWVEAQADTADSDRPVRSGDGVTPVLITGNDFAAAWAVDDNGRPLLPTVPNDPVQRLHAFRAGTNIVMYMLTGNYKADQVHVPALLERLGQ